MRGDRLPHGVLVVALAAFVILSLAALLVGTVGADTVIRERLLAFATPHVVSVTRVVNVAGDWKFLLPATLALLAVFDRARRTWWVWVALMVAAPIAESVMKIKMRSVLCVPILTAGRPLGALYLDNRFTEGAFQPNQVMMMFFV